MSSFSKSRSYRMSRITETMLDRWVELPNSLFSARSLWNTPECLDLGVLALGKLWLGLAPSQDLETVRIPAATWDPLGSSYKRKQPPLWSLMLTINILFSSHSLPSFSSNTGQNFTPDKLNSSLKPICDSFLELGPWVPFLWQVGLDSTEPRPESGGQWSQETQAKPWCGTGLLPHTLGALNSQSI